MSISTISVQTLTGPASLLNRLVKELVEGYCHSEDIMFLDEKTVQVTLYNALDRPFSIMQKLFL
ncbi:hypothetical protein BJI49_13285 [Acetobacter pasteurianus]|nr:hypothetical protein BJI49_13285 [Acetobacter pasteurianus]